jgi:hypothetical protein
MVKRRPPVQSRPMADDWRLRITFQGNSRADELRDRLEATDLEHRLENHFLDSVAISADDDEVFAYAGTREQAEAVGELVRKEAAANKWQVELELKRWHPTAEDWEDPDKPLPTTDAEKAAEHAALIEREREDSTDTGHPEFEVRVKFHHHHAAVEFARQLREEGFVVVQRWHFLIIGASDEDSAKALAERIAAEAPAGAVVNSEGTQRTVSEGSGGNPFAYFGGLGG